MSGVPCHGCPTGEATIQEKRGERLAFCTKECQRAFYGIGCHVEDEAQPQPQQGWSIVYEQQGGLRGVNYKKVVHQDGRVEHWSRGKRQQGQPTLITKKQAQAIFIWAMEKEETHRPPCCDFVYLHVSIHDANGEPILARKEIDEMFLPGNWVVLNEKVDQSIAQAQVQQQQQQPELIGYGLFGVVRGPPDRPDKVPQNMRNLFFMIVKGAMDSARAEGNPPLLAALVAENLEMMFLPADANDPGFTDDQRALVFGYLFMPGQAKGLRTVLGVDDIRDFKQRVLAIAMRRGYLHTARYIVERMRGKPWEIFEEGAESPRLFFQMLGRVPLARRLPMLRWLLDVLGGETLKGFHARWVLMYLAVEIVGADDVDLYHRIVPYVDVNSSSLFMLRRAIFVSALHTSKLVLDTAKLFNYVEAEVLLWESLYVQPYTKAAAQMTTLLLEKLRPFMSDRVSPQRLLKAAMHRGRTDVFEAVLRLYPVTGISSDVRALIANASGHGDHEYVRIYARYELNTKRAMSVAFSILMENYPLMMNEQENTEGEAAELWIDVDELLEARPPDVLSPVIAQARTLMSAKVLAGLAGEMPYFWTLMRAVGSNEFELLRNLIHLAPAAGHPVSPNGRNLLFEHAIGLGTMRSLIVLQEEFHIQRESIQNAAIMLSTTDAGFALDVVQMTGADSEDVSRMLFDLSDMIVNEHAPGRDQRSRQIMLGMLERYPHLVWEHWNQNRTYYHNAGLDEAALSFQSRRQRQEEGRRKAARHVEKRVIL